LPWPPWPSNYSIIPRRTSSPSHGPVSRVCLWKFLEAAPLHSSSSDASLHRQWRTGHWQSLAVTGSHWTALTGEESRSYSSVDTLTDCPYTNRAMYYLLYNYIHQYSVPVQTTLDTFILPSIFLLNTSKYSCHTVTQSHSHTVTQSHLQT